MRPKIYWTECIIKSFASLANVKSDFSLVLEIYFFSLIALPRVNLLAVSVLEFTYFSYSLLSLRLLLDTGSTASFHEVGSIGSKVTNRNFPLMPFVALDSKRRTEKSVDTIKTDLRVKLFGPLLDLYRYCEKVGRWLIDRGPFPINVTSWTPDRYPYRRLFLESGQPIKKVSRKLNPFGESTIGRFPGEGKYTGLH
ncbi:hypothetical protein V1478_010548 [Vespula squamosa]|uniref:Uncharacterized protein n=1 Tax=Vespula squamosa TaxID=30214 RepID=A0ABD2AI33_VESSQ